MTGLEELGWYAFGVVAQVIDPAVWFLVARERYEWAAAPRHREGSGSRAHG